MTIKEQICQATDTLNTLRRAYYQGGASYDDMVAAARAVLELRQEAERARLIACGVLTFKSWQCYGVFTHGSFGAPRSELHRRLRAGGPPHRCLCLWRVLGRALPMV